MNQPKLENAHREQGALAMKSTHQDVFLTNPNGSQLTYWHGSKQCQVLTHLRNAYHALSALVVVVVFVVRRRRCCFVVAGGVFGVGLVLFGVAVAVASVAAVVVLAMVVLGFCWWLLTHLPSLVSCIIGHGYKPS